MQNEQLPSNPNGSAKPPTPPPPPPPPSPVVVLPANNNVPGFNLKLQLANAKQNLKKVEVTKTKSDANKKSVNQRQNTSSTTLQDELKNKFRVMRPQVKGRRLEDSNSDSDWENTNQNKQQQPCITEQAHAEETLVHMTEVVTLPVEPEVASTSSSMIEAVKPEVPFSPPSSEALPKVRSSTIAAAPIESPKAVKPEVPFSPPSSEALPKVRSSTIAAAPIESPKAAAKPEVPFSPPSLEAPPELASSPTVASEVASLKRRAAFTPAAFEFINRAASIPVVAFRAAPTVTPLPHNMDSLLTRPQIAQLQMHREYANFAAIVNNLNKSNLLLTGVDSLINNQNVINLINTHDQATKQVIINWMCNKITTYANEKNDIRCMQLLQRLSMQIPEIKEFMKIKNNNMRRMARR